MTKQILLGAVIAGIAGTAHADVTARQVWDDWVAAIEGGAAALSTGSVEEADGRLTITDLEMTSQLEEGSYHLAVDEVVLDENDDGTVTVTLSPSYPMTIEGRDSEDRPTSLTFEISHPGLSLTVSGDEESRRHAYEAPDIDVTLTEATVDGEPMDFSLTAVLTDTSGSYVVDENDTGRFNSELMAGSARLDASGTDPEGGTFDMSFELADLAADNITSFLEAEMVDTSAALRDGFSTEGGLSYGQSSYTLEGENEGDRFKVEGSAAGGEITARISSDGLSYGSQSSGTRLALSGDQIPIPEIVLEIGETEGKVELPVLARDEAQDFGLLLRLADVKIDEDVWSMVDPAGLLPRDPATLVVDLSGTATLTQDLFSADTDGETAPGTLDTMTVNALRLALLGAELTGEGDLEFKPGEKTEDGPAAPQPVGQIDFRLVGAEALMDRLVQMGLLPEDQLMGVRMMIGVFAKPGEGDDTLSSTLEFTEDGQVIANGQRIR